MGQFSTNMGGFGAAGPSLYAANPMGGAQMNRGPGIESFQKDGFKVFGREIV